MGTAKNKGSLSRKMTLLSLLMAVVICAGACIVGYVTYRRSTFGTYNNFAYQVGEVILSRVDGNRVAGYLDVESRERDPAYADMAKSIRAVFDSMDLTSIYLCVPDPENLTVTTIYDVRVHTAGNPALYEQGVVDPIGSYPLEVVNIYLTGERSRNYFIRKNNFGYNTSAILPVKDDSGSTTALLVVDVPMPDIVNNLNHYLLLTIVITVLLTGPVMFLNMAYLRRRVVRPIILLTDNAQEFAGHRSGFSHDLLQVRTGDEIQTLAQALSQMEVDIVNYIDNLAAVTSEKERIGAELDVATQIQASMLPSIFPAFPERPEFDIYATMEPAKEVGGDFYDFFLVDEDHLALVMADVSGKGVPAALFMVIAKTLLKNAAQMGLSPKEVLAKVNGQLCENNEAEMFVTVWLGILEISTGKLTCANAGHEYPALRRADGAYELVKDKHGFVLAGMDGSRYREYELRLAPGDELYVYTDGVPEATNAAEDLFGTGRMLEALNLHPGAGPEDLLPSVKAAIDRFVGAAPQFDDITMLGLRYLGPEQGGSLMKEITLPAALENLANVQAFIEGELEACGCPMKAMMQISVAVEEIYVNIARYAYHPKVGEATVRCAVDGEPLQVTIQFLDHGKPFDPLAKPDADTTLSAEEREIGGLGILMVKRSMDDVRYEYKDGCNILTLKKHL